MLKIIHEVGDREDVEGVKMNGRVKEGYNLAPNDSITRHEVAKKKYCTRWCGKRWMELLAHKVGEVWKDMRRNLILVIAWATEAEEKWWQISTWQTTRD